VTPPVTFLAAVAINDEAFHSNGIAGGLVAVVGVVAVFIEQIQAAQWARSWRFGLQPGVIAAATLWVRRMPRGQPVAVNAVAMIPGAAFLLLLAVATGEPAAVPRERKPGSPEATWSRTRRSCSSASSS
jgi:hypothetical protein